MNLPISLTMITQVLETCQIYLRVLIISLKKDLLMNQRCMFKVAVVAVF